MFLDITDYAQVIKPQILNQIIENDDTLRIKAELNSQSIMEDYLRLRYDAVAIFSAVGGARHKTVLLYMLYLTVYQLHQRVQGNNIPEMRIANWEEAMGWLKRVHSGATSPDLPLLNVGGEPVKGVFVSSNKARETFDY